MGSKRVIVTAARHGCSRVPVRVSADALGGKGAVALKDRATGLVSPTQIMDESGRRSICWILEPLGKGESREYEVVPGVGGAGVELVDFPGDRVEFHVGGGLFTAYRYGGELARPFLHPVIGPEGKCVTRGYPMVEGVPGETTDHFHHRGIWVAFGDVNGVDDWSEDPGHGKIVHREFVEKTSGPVFARIRVLNDWTAPDGGKIIEEERTITVYNTPDTRRLMDLSVVFRATRGDVSFGDTKEGGIIAVRVATTMDGERGGTITNSYGGVSEAETWGKPAHWCDYSGAVDGGIVGISVFDTPGNFRYPTYWHVRDYGLFTANPFALSAYFNDPSRDGSFVLESGGILSFSYRVYIHDGDAAAARVAEEYHSYINPPQPG